MREYLFLLDGRIIWWWLQDFYLNFFFFFFVSQCPGMVVGAPSVLSVVFYYWNKIE